MKTPEELAALKAELEALNAKLAALTDDELAQVAGGTGDHTPPLCTKLDEALALFPPLCKGRSLSPHSRIKLSRLEKDTSIIRDDFSRLRDGRHAAEALSAVLTDIRSLPEANSSSGLSQLISVLTAAYDLVQ